MQWPSFNLYVPLLSECRHGTNTGGIGLGKADATSPQASIAVRSSFSKAEQDNGLLLHDRRDRPIGSEKEKLNVRAVNKYGNN